MRSRLLLLLVVVNVGLFAALGYLWKKRSAGAGANSEDGAALAHTITRDVRGGISHAEFVAQANAFEWRMVESPDYRELIENLRAIGCPQETLQDIVLARIEKYYGARVAALKLKPEYAKPWELNSWSGKLLAEKQRQYRDLMNEKRALVKELLGIDLPIEMPALLASRNTERYETALEKLPENKREIVRSIQEDYWSRAEALHDRTKGFWEPEDLEEYKRLKTEYRDSLARNLAPQELEDYDIATSSTASNLRFELSAFSANDQEFRDIFRVKHKIDLEFNLPGSVENEQEMHQRRSLANEEAEKEIERVLGEKRYAEYKLSQDWNYRSIARYVQENNLPKETALKAYEVNQLAQQEAAKIRADQTLTSDQRQVLLKSMQGEMEKALVGMVGQEGFTRLRNYGIGRVYSASPSLSSLKAPQPMPSTAPIIIPAR